MMIPFNNIAQLASACRQSLKFQAGAVVPLPKIKVYTTPPTKSEKECLNPLFVIKNGQGEAYIPMSERESFDRALVLGLAILLRLSPDAPDITVKRCFEPKEQKPLLRAAGLFAACFLLPEAFLRKDLSERAWTVGDLAQKYDVLPHVIRLRLVGLGLWDAQTEQPKRLNQETIGCKKDLPL